ncbi:MAG: SpaA isopeptide-forming pilin-related protein [Peptoniphilus harei]|nr:SpaA isopeptide-forming pilin-related protein [Peptoniphilus harei]
MNKKKILSLIMALVMLVGVFSPLTALAADEVTVPTGVLNANDLSATKPDTTEVNIYKLTTKQNYKAGAPWKHTGGKIEDISKLGTDVEYLKGAKFSFYKINVKVDPNTTKTDGTEAKTQAEADKLNEKYFNIIKGTPADFDSVEDMQDVMTKGYPKDPNATKTIPAGVVELAVGNGLTKVEFGNNNPKTYKAETAATTGDGLATVKLPDGYYWAVESVTPDKVTSAIAVPFGLTLPLMNGKDVGDKKAGTHYLTKLYIYPKNVQTDDVQIDKDHANYDNTTGKWYDKDGKEVNSEDLGIKYADYQREKKTVSRQLNEDSPFQSDTTIPRNYTFDSFSWIDTMSEGLTYNKDVEVTIDYTDAQGAKKEKQPFINAENKKTFVTERDNGFEITVKKEQVKDTLVEYLKNGPVTFHFKYSAKVNNSAVVDKPQSNSITFKPGEPTGVPNVNSKDSKIEIAKSWKKDNKDATQTAKDLTYYVEDEHGKTVASVTVKATATAGTKIDAGKGITFTVGANFGSGTFEGLPEGSYKVREAVNGYEPTYNPDNTNGKLTIVNNDKPEVKKPSEPTVEFHGKKFVKTDQLKNEDRLFGAEFVIRNNSDDANNPDKGKFLVVKAGTQKIEEETAVKAAKKALDAKIAAYNALNAQQQEEQKATYEGEINTLQKAYNDAVIAARTEFTWVEGTGAKKDVPPTDAYKLVSDGQGRFEITGLSAGKYELIEITAPVGYAKLESPVPFEVKHGTYTKDESANKINYNKADTEAKDALRVDNKKVTIPQTGGMGTVLFTVVGIGLMAGAVMAMKKNREEA